MTNGKATIDTEKIATIAYLYGRQQAIIETQLQGFADSLGLPRPEVTRGFGRLLSRTEEIWDVLRSSDSLLLRSNTSPESKKKRRGMEMGNRSRKKSLKSDWSKLTTAEQRKKALKKSTKGRKYNGTHWMQKPENKARVVAMMKARNKARFKKKKAA